MTLRSKVQSASILMAILFLEACSAGGYASRSRAHHYFVSTSQEDVDAEIVFGREVAAKILNNYSLYENEKMTVYINLVAKSLALQSNRPELRYTVGILDTTDVNAFAAPGGYIFVTLGAIRAMENEAELAGVVAHEMIHINEKHIVRELKIKGKGSGGLGLGKLAGGATESFHVAFRQAVDNAMVVLFKDGYAQKDEIEADTLATLLVALKGYDPKALPTYFNRIKSRKKESTSSLLELHPPFETRIRWINNAIEKEGLNSLQYQNHSRRFDEHAKG